MDGINQTQLRGALETFFQTLSYPEQEDTVDELLTNLGIDPDEITARSYQDACILTREEGLVLNIGNQTFFLTITEK